MNNKAIAPQTKIRMKFTIHPYVFGFSAGLILLFIVVTLANLDTAESTFTAINDAMQAAVTDGTLGREDVASASLVRETSDTARLTLRSGGTGFDNRLTFTDSADGLLGLLELDSAALADPEGAGGGQITAVGTDDQSSALNARFTLDGLTLYRSSNEVSDARPH